MRRGQRARKSGAVPPTWQAAAVQYRKVLELLGWAVPHCLPGEAGAGGCSGSDAEHAASYLGVLQAIVEAKIGHLHGGEHIVAASYAETVAELAELDASRPCGREH